MFAKGKTVNILFPLFPNLSLYLFLRAEVVHASCMRAAEIKVK